MSIANWVAEKLVANEKLQVPERTPEGFLIVKSRDDYAFKLAVLGHQDLIKQSDVATLFECSNAPDFVVNVPSKALWSGDAIHRIHLASAAFGKFGDISRAAATGDAGSFRDKNMQFFIDAMTQHSNVLAVSYVYETVLRADRRKGSSLIVAVVDAYNLSAEDVRYAKDRFGHFDIIVKSSSYGGITQQADAAAKSVGATAVMFSQLLKRLAK